MTGCMLTALKKPLRVERAHYPAYVMVLVWGVMWGCHPAPFLWTRSQNACCQLPDRHFGNSMKLLNNTLFAERHWIFQQDSAPSHKAKTTQWSLETNSPEFIVPEDWSSGSPDLNPLDYHLWNILEEKACCMPHHHIETLKADLVKSAASVPLDVVRVAIDKWPGCLRKFMKTKGGRFE